MIVHAVYDATTQMHPWVSVPFKWRLGFGVLFFLSYLVLLYEVLTIGKKVPQAEVKPA